MALTKDQEKELTEHAKTHTDEHMRVMRERMEIGDSFNLAHMTALKMVGD